MPSLNQAVALAPVRKGACRELMASEKRYRMAVHAYGDAVDHLDSSLNFGEAWHRIELARAPVERARIALLEHIETCGCAELKTLGPVEMLDLSDELVLGDQGQFGG